MIRDTEIATLKLLAEFQPAIFKGTIKISN